MPKPNLDIRDALRRNPLLSRFGPAGLDGMFAAAETLRFAAGEVPFRRGEEARRVFLIVSGRIDLLLDDESGNRTRVETMAAPRLLGLSCVLGGATYAYTAVVDSESALMLGLPGADIVAELAVNPEAAQALLAETSVRLRRLVGQLGDLKLRDSVQRLAGYLIELCAAELGAAEVILPSEKRAVADRLGMKAETLSRALARLEALGLAQSAENARSGESARVRLPDVARLRHLYLVGEGHGLS